jgi:hypothetical protein
MASKWKAGTFVAGLGLLTISSAYAGPKDASQFDADGRTGIHHVL